MIQAMVECWLGGGEEKIVAVFISKKMRISVVSFFFEKKMISLCASGFEFEVCAVYFC